MSDRAQSVSDIDGRQIESLLHDLSVSKRRCISNYVKSNRIVPGIVQIQQSYCRLRDKVQRDEFSKTLKDQIIAVISQLYSLQMQLNSQLAVPRSKAINGQDPSRELSLSKIESITKQINKLESLMTYHRNSLLDTDSITDFIQIDPEYQKNRERLAAYCLREEELDQMLTNMIDRKIRNIVTNCEIVGDDGQNVFVKLYNDYDQKGRQAPASKRQKEHRQRKLSKGSLLINPSQKGSQIGYNIWLPKDSVDRPIEDVSLILSAFQQSSLMTSPKTSLRRRRKRILQEILEELTPF